MRVLIFLLVILLALPFAPAAGRSQDISDEVEATLVRTQDAISAWFARTLPLPSASAGVSYSFDPATGNFRRDPATFGQVHIERADPLGTRHFNVSFAYQYAELDTLEGMDADHLVDPLPIPFAGLAAAFDIPFLHVAAAVHSFLFSATYGFTDDFDVSLAVPVMLSDLDVESRVRGFAVTRLGVPVFTDERIDDSSHPVGVGDVLLRAKYRVLELAEVHAATGLLLRLPAGDKEDLQGTGFVEVAPSLLASTRIFEFAQWARFQGHLNAAVGFNADNVDSSDARWGVGLDWGITEDITAAVAVLGRHPFARIVPKGTFLLPRCSSDLVTCAVDESVRDTSALLFGLTGDRVDYYNLSLGGRAGLWRDTIFGFINFAIPLNDGFVRTKPIPMIGIEATI